MLVRCERPGKRPPKWLLFCEHYHISFPGNFPSKSLPESLGRLVRSTERCPLARGRMKYRFGCSKVQVAYKSRISVAPAAFPRVPRISASAQLAARPCERSSPRSSSWRAGIRQILRQFDLRFESLGWLVIITVSGRPIGFLPSSI